MVTGLRWVDFVYLVEELDRVRIAHLLRKVAETCAAQIADPTGWSVLDRLDETDTVRIGSVMKRLLQELVLLERVIALYDAGRQPAGGLLAANPLVPNRNFSADFAGINLPVSDKDAQPFAEVGLDERARAQLAVWRAAHGAELEAVLQDKIEQVRDQIATLRRRLKARADIDQHNTVLGNIGRCNAGLKLYLAVQDAVAWTAEPKYPEAKTLEEALRRAFAPKPSELPGFAVALGWASSSSDRTRCPRPSRSPSHAFMAVQLFTVLRFAFLRDNEMLPASLRQVRDPVTGREKDVKTPAKAAAIVGRPYTFSELWTAHEAQRLERLDRLPSTASNSDRSARVTPDNVFRDAADRVRRSRLGMLTRRQRDAVEAFNAQVERGYTVHRSRLPSLTG